MAGQLQDFLAHFSRYGVAKTSHFQFDCPAWFPGTQFSGSREVLSLRCEATELPGRQLVSEDAHIYGPSYKAPYQSVYQELNLTFLETSNFFVRAFFETWLNSIFDSATNKIDFPDETWADCTLTQYDVTLVDPDAPRSSLKTIAKWTLHNSIPTAVNQMPVSWTEDGLHRTTVTLAYQWYTLATTTAPIPPATAPIKSEPKLPRGSGVTNPFNFLKF